MAETVGECALVREGILNIQVCTSLSDEEATDRANLKFPSGIRSDWILSAVPENAPVPCADRPDTHRHLIFEC